MASKKQKKVPKALVIPVESKTPKARITPSDNACPDYKTEQMDSKGPWGWNGIDSIQLQEIFQRIFDSQKITWQELRNTGSHYVEKEALCPEAQRRLIEIQKDDLDQLFSLRVTGRKRIWGIKEGKIFWLLWWDPNHEVCPSHKKHT